MPRNAKLIMGGQKNIFCPYSDGITTFICFNSEFFCVRVEQRNEKFKEYQKSKMEACNGLNLASLIITPIQRVPRYELLLRDMIKNMEEEHPDYSELNKAYELVKAVNLDINQDMAVIKDHKGCQIEIVYFI